MKTHGTVVNLHAKLVEIPAFWKWHARNARVLEPRTQVLVVFTTIVAPAETKGGGQNRSWAGGQTGFTFKHSSRYYSSKIIG